MLEALKTVLFVLFVIGALYLAFRIAGWKMKQACDVIIRDLTEKKAFDPASAVELPYATEKTFRLGLRDYRPRALEELLRQGRVRMLSGGRYFLL
jgi:hypothetical protein